LSIPGIGLVPITWRNRRFGVPKLKIKEMGSRYFFIRMYVWLVNISAAEITRNRNEPIRFFGLDHH
jgi:dolichol-phosphate mannosyltransferase